MKLVKFDNTDSYTTYDVMTPSDFIDQIINDGLPMSPWIPPTFENDFILLSEFSEIEGPKPLITIPSFPANSSFNLNSFSVRIMSADCVSIMHEDDFSNFKVAGDIKVVLTELREGAVAYVHHFVLYDIAARGYVRPFCLAYITNNYSAIMNHFHELLRYFTTACQLIRFGNALNFLSDLLIRLDHLTELARLIEKNSIGIMVDGKPIADSEQSLITPASIEEIKQQLLDLRNAFLKYIDSETFIEHRTIFATQYETINLRINQCDTKTQREVNCRTKMTSQVEEVLNQQVNLFMDDIDDEISFCEFPSDVIASVLGKRHFRELRPLHDLCMSTFPLSFEILKSSLNIKFRVTKFDDVSDMRSRKYEIFYCGVEFPVLTVYTQGISSSCCSHIHPEGLNLSPFSLEAFLSEYHNRQRDKVEDTKKQLSEYANYQTNQVIPFNQISPQTSPMSKSPVSKQISARFTRETKEGFIILDENACNSSDDKQPSDEGSCDSFKDVYTTQFSSSLPSLNSNKTSSPDPSIFCRSVSTGNGDDGLNIALSSIDIRKCSRVSLLSLRKRFSFLSHVVYSLFLRRPVVIIADEKQKPRIRKLIYCLTNFIPLHCGPEKRIIPWCSSPLRIEDLCRLSLIGISKSTKTNPVPFSLRCYVTLLDYDNQTLTAPPYEGTFLSNLFDTTRTFYSEQVFRNVIRQRFTEIISLAHVQFSVIFAQKGKFGIGGHRPQKLYSTVFRPYKYLSDCDANIIREVSSCFQEIMLTSHQENIYGCHDNPNCIKLNLMKCSIFANKAKKR